MNIGRQAVAQRMIDRTVTDLDAERIKSENERLKAEIERDKLSAERQGSTSASDGFRDFIMGQLERVNAQLADTQKALTEQQATAMQERISMLSSELAEIQRRGASEPPNVVAATRQALEDARALAEMLGPSPTPPPVTRSDDPQIRAWEVRARLDHELRMRQLDSEEKRRDRETEAAERRRDREVEGKIEIEKAKIDIERQRAELLDRFARETGPKLLETGQQILAIFTSKAPPAPGAFGGAIAPGAAAQAVPQIPEGLMSFPCQQCGQPVVYRPEFTHAGCLACGSQYQLQPDKPSTDDAAKVDTPSVSYDDEDDDRPTSLQVGGLNIH